MLTHGNRANTRAVSFSKRSRLSPNGKSTCKAAIENNDISTPGTHNCSMQGAQPYGLRNRLSTPHGRQIVNAAVIQHP